MAPLKGGSCLLGVRAGQGSRGAGRGAGGRGEEVLGGLGHVVPDDSRTLALSWGTISGLSTSYSREPQIPSHMVTLNSAGANTESRVAVWPKKFKTELNKITQQRARVVAQR